MRDVTPLTAMKDGTSGATLKREMEQRGVTVAQLAKMTGINARTITALRSGKSEGNMATWRVIARRLGCTIDEIVG